MDFSFYLHNEYIILYCCDLERDTWDEIHQRSITNEAILLETINGKDDEDSVNF